MIATQDDEAILNQNSVSNEQHDEASSEIDANSALRQPHAEEADKKDPFDARIFLKNLRENEPERWLNREEERYAQLVSLKQELLAIDQDLKELCKLRPENEEQYVAQHSKAELQLLAKARDIFPELRPPKSSELGPGGSSLA